MPCSRMLASAITGWALSVSLIAQGVPAGPPAEVTELARGWAALAAGNAAQAASIGAQTLSWYPRSLSAATLVVHAETSRAGADAGLSAYERWVENRADDPYLLRVVGVAVLREALRANSSAEARRQALQTLSTDRDVVALTELAQIAAKGGIIELQVLGALGSEPAVQQLAGMLKNDAGDKSIPITALLNTGSPLAVRPLIAVLPDPNPNTRMAAADALGKLGSNEAIPPLRRLLDDANFTVKFAAARALYRLKDPSGLSLLRTLAASEHAMLRAQALEALSTDADQAWISDVRRLLTEADPQVRLAAARLIAPYDPEAARLTFQGLLADGNVAIREVSAQAYLENVADFGLLRRYLRSAEVLTRVKAARRVLELSR